MPFVPSYKNNSKKYESFHLRRRVENPHNENYTIFDEIDDVCSYLPNGNFMVSFSGKQFTVCKQNGRINRNMVYEIRDGARYHLVENSSL